MPSSTPALLQGSPYNSHLTRGDGVELAQDLARRLGVPAGRARIRAGKVHVCREDSHVWVPVDDDLISTWASEYAGVTVRPEHGAPRLIKLSERQLKGVTAGVIREAGVHGGRFPERAEGAAFADGLVVIDGGKILLRDFQPEDGVLETELLPMSFAAAADQEAEVWPRFLGQSFRGTEDAEQRIEFLEAYVGLALLSATHRYKRTPVLHGESNTGKSVFILAVSALFPADHQVSHSYQDLQDPNVRAGLLGARLNTVTELPEQRLRDTASIKAILSGEPVSARRLYNNPFVFSPRCAHLVAANHLPDTFDLALLQRWSIVPFPNVVPAEERDVDLPKKLAAEAPMIARRALQAACKVVLRGRLDEPPSSTLWRRQWAEGSDSARLWIAAKLEEDAEGCMTAEELYPLYAQWANRNGFQDVREINAVGLGIRLASRFEKADRTSRRRGWRVRPAAEAESSTATTSYEVPP